MGFIDNIRDAWNSFTNSIYEDEYDEIQYNQYGQYNQDYYSNVNMSSSAPDYSYYQQPEQYYEPEQHYDENINAAPLQDIEQNIVSEIALVQPETVESVRDAADHLIKNRAVVLNLKNTEVVMARRWLDYLGGTTYAVNGKINRIAPYTYLLTPKGVNLVAGFESEA